MSQTNGKPEMAADARIERVEAMIALTSYAPQGTIKIMTDFDTMTVTKVGQATLPKWWRDASGLSEGGVVEVRPVRDGQNSILLTPKPAKRRGAVGLLKQMAACPAPMPAPKRHALPSE